MLFKPTPLLATRAGAGEIGHILQMARNAIEASGSDAVRFDCDGNTGAGIYETWKSADGTHYVVSHYEGSTADEYE